MYVTLLAPKTEPSMCPSLNHSHRIGSQPSLVPNPVPMTIPSI